MTSNKKIRNATECRSNNITFKSQLEKTIYNTLIEAGFSPKYEPMTFMLWNGFTSFTPFYDKESDTKRKRRIQKGDKDASRLLTLKDPKVIGIRYTPDFYFKYKDLDVYIEAKGIENDVFYIKKKLFRKYLDERLATDKQHSIYFEIYTKKQTLQAINIIKDYEQYLQEVKETNRVSPSKR